MNEYLTELLSTDPLSEAEKITGQSYKDDAATMHLGFLMGMAHNRDKTVALQKVGDSHFSMNLADTLALYARLGFTEVLCDEFVGRSWNDEPAPAETFHILWHPDGILATVESYQTTGRNTTKVYYNVRFTDDEGWSRYTSSGCFHRESFDAGDRVWVGDHDAREGVTNTLTRLRDVGEFLPQWIERPHMWLVTYSEADAAPDWPEASTYYDGLREGRIARLPEHVRAAIGGAS